MCNQKNINKNCQNHYFLNNPFMENIQYRDQLRVDIVIQKNEVSLESIALEIIYMLQLFFYNHQIKYYRTNNKLIIINKITMRHQSNSLTYSLHYSLQKQYKTYRQPCQNHVFLKNKTNYFNLTQRQRSNFKLSQHLKLNSKQDIKSTQKLVNDSIQNSFHKRFKLKTNPVNNSKSIPHQHIFIHKSQNNNKSSQKKLQKLSKRLFISNSCEGPSFWTYDPKPQKFMRTIAKNLTFSKGIGCNQLNLKKQIIPQLSNANIYFEEKSQNQFKEKNDIEKYERKLKRKPTFNYFMNEDDKKVGREKQNNLQKKLRKQQKIKVQLSQNYFLQKRVSKQLQKFQQLRTKYQKSLLVSVPLKIKQVDKAYQNQKRKYNIRESSCGYLNNIKISDLVRTQLDQQVINSNSCYVISK